MKGTDLRRLPQPATDFMASLSAPVHRVTTHNTFAVQKSIVSSRRRPSSNGHPGRPGR